MWGIVLKFILIILLVTFGVLFLTKIVKTNEKLDFVNTELDTTIKELDTIELRLQRLDFISREEILNNTTLSLPEKIYYLTGDKTKLPERKELSAKEQVVQIIYEVALQEDYSNPKLLVAIATAEGKLNPLQRGEIDYRDRGLYQINSYHNSHVSDDCAFDSWCSTRWTIQEINEGRIWKWNASRYKWGKYL